MNRDNQPWWPVSAAAISWSETGDPVSTEFGDVYYSRENGAEESRHVFLQGSGLPGRWQGRERFCIAETGFGTGLNFLLTWQAWQALPEPRPRLHYLSIEKYPLPPADMARALGAWPDLQPLAEAMLARWPGPLPGSHRLSLAGGRVVLDLWWQDVADALPDIASHGPCVDAWYLDGFAPARNEAMWRDSLYPALAAASRPGATVATFTAAGTVRRGLAGAGFTVAKVDGFGRKRESLRAVLPASGPPLPFDDTPWDLSGQRATAPDTALVLGAGLAGCFTAAALARRGVQVQVLEAGDVAGAASGNEQGILYTRLSLRHGALTDFALTSFQHAVGEYRALFRDGRLREAVDGALCGSFHLHDDTVERTALAERLATCPSLCEVLAPEAAATHLGIMPAGAGLWFPHSGWLHPPAVCRALLAQPGISLRSHCGPVTLRPREGAWQAWAGEQLLAEADSAIICTGVDAGRQPATGWLPLQAIRGQTSLLPAFRGSEALRAGYCHEGYVAPAREGIHCIGATFKLRDPDASLRTAEHRHNLDRLAAALPGWRHELEQLDAAALSGRVGYRCASPDYLPIAGPVPNRDHFLQTYAGLRKNARQTIAERGSYLPGLYVNTAHGSRGLTSTPLVAEVLASQILGESPPLERSLLRALSPARFLIRDLGRNRV